MSRGYHTEWRIPAAHHRTDPAYVEGGGTAPTLALLRQLATALDAQLDASIDAEQTRLAFVPHAA